jgi:hypothetical protein
MCTCDHNEEERMETLCVVKLDMLKADNWVEWVFLKEVMLKMGL